MLERGDLLTAANNGKGPVSYHGLFETLGYSPRRNWTRYCCFLFPLNCRRVLVTGLEWRQHEAFNPLPHGSPRFEYPRWEGKDLTGLALHGSCDRLAQRSFFSPECSASSPQQLKHGLLACLEFLTYKSSGLLKSRLKHFE